MNIGQRVYSSHMDLFGTIVQRLGGGALYMVKWDWPYDPSAPAEFVDGLLHPLRPA